MVKTTTIAAVLLGAFVLTASAQAALIVDFKPEPTSEHPEILYVGGGPALPALRAGPGATGNGDSGLPPSQQTPGGLTVEFPFPLPGIPGGTVNSTGTTTVRDVSLRLTGLEQAGVGNDDGSTTTQSLSAGTFQLIAGEGLGAPPVPLLQGNIGDAVIVLLNSGSTGSVLSSTVTYTGGMFFSLLGPLTHGELSFSLINVTELGIASPAIVTDFSADATGQFTLVPEPASATLLALASLLALRRRRPMK